MFLNRNGYMTYGDDESREDAGDRPAIVLVLLLMPCTNPEYFPCGRSMTRVFLKGLIVAVVYVFVAR
jgi:hypothetical protein